MKLILWGQVLDTLPVNESVSMFRVILKVSAYWPVTWLKDSLRLTGELFEHWLLKVKPALEEDPN